jgi:hypothetical protein
MHRSAQHACMHTALPTMLFPYATISRYTILTLCSYVHYHTPTLSTLASNALCSHPCAPAYIIVRLASVHQSIATDTPVANATTRTTTTSAAATSAAAATGTVTVTTATAATAAAAGGVVTAAAIVVTSH